MSLHDKFLLLIFPHSELNDSFLSTWPLFGPTFFHLQPSSLHISSQAFVEYLEWVAH